MLKVNLADAAMANKDNSVTMRLLAGHTPHDKQQDGTTALHWAALHGNVMVMKRLIDKGADVRARTMHGNTPLHFAALSRVSETINLLIKHNADIMARNYVGHTPLHYATFQEIRATQA